ncbi:MAG: hypothetical protein JEZ08_04625 [Clostridiales bacterium]|nr:hypothetical protein [Clostridiales bacterium]
MIEKIKIEFFRELSKMAEEIDAQIIFLKEEDRSDESNLEKVKLNVLDIFKQMFDVSYRKVFNPGNRNDETVKLSEFKRTYLEFYDKIPNNWYESLTLAKKNDDFEKVLVEELKIETMKKVRTCFDKCWEV